MKEINKYLIIIFYLFFSFSVQAKSNLLSIGSIKAKVTVKVFSSLTCPHCADFHNSVFSDLKKDYIDKGLVKFEHHAFPLDLAALNAEIIIRCQSNNEKRFKLLKAIYDKQKFWAVGSNIEKINDLIKKVGEDYDLSEEIMDKCLNDSNTQDEILNQRIEAKKNIKLSQLLQLLLMKKNIPIKQIINHLKKRLKKFINEI